MPKIHFEKFSRDDFHSVKIHVYKPEGRLSSIWSWLTMQENNSESFHKALNKNSFKLKVNPECLQELKARGELQKLKNNKAKTLQSSVQHEGKENVPENDFKFPLKKIKLVNNQCADLVTRKTATLIKSKHFNNNTKGFDIPKSQKCKTARNVRCKVGMKNNTNLSQTKPSQVFHKNTNVLLKSIPSTILHSNTQMCRAERKSDQINETRDIEKPSGQHYTKEEPNPIPKLLTKIESMEKHLSDVETKTNKLNELILKQNAFRMRSGASYDLNTKDSSTAHNVTNNCVSHKVYSKKAHSSQSLKKSHKPKKEKANVSLSSNHSSKTDNLKNKGYPFEKFKDSLNTVLIDDNKKKEKPFEPLSSNDCSKTNILENKGHPIEKFKDSLNTLLMDDNKNTPNNLVNRMGINFERYHRIIAVPNIIASESLDAQIMSVFKCFSTLSELEINSSSTFSQPEVETHVSQHTLAGLNLGYSIQSKPTSDRKYTSLSSTSDSEVKQITGDSEDTIPAIKNTLIPAANNDVTQQSFKLKELVAYKSVDENQSSNRFPCICLVDSEHLSYVDSENSSAKLDHRNSVSQMNILENSELIVHKESIGLHTQFDEHKTSEVSDSRCCKPSLKKIVTSSYTRTQKPKLKITILVEDGSKAAVEVESKLNTQWKESKATDNICNRPLAYFHTEEDNSNPHKTTKNDSFISQNSYFALNTSNTHNLLKTYKSSTFLKTQELVEMRSAFCRICSDTSNMKLNIHGSAELPEDNDVKFGVEGKYIYQNQRNVCDSVNLKKFNVVPEFDPLTTSETSMKNKLFSTEILSHSLNTGTQKLSSKVMRPDYFTNKFGYFKPLLKENSVSGDKYETSKESKKDKQHCCKCFCSKQHTSSNKTHNSLQEFCQKTSEISSVTVQTDWTLVGDSVDQKHSVSCQTDVQMKEMFREEIPDYPEFDKYQIQNSQFKELAPCQPVISDKKSTDKENKNHSNRFIPKKWRSLAIAKKKELRVTDDKPSNLLFSLVRNNEVEITPTHDIRPEDVITEFCNKDTETVNPENTILPSKDQNNHVVSQNQQSANANSTVETETTHHCSSTCFPSWSDESFLSKKSDSACSFTENRQPKFCNSFYYTIP